MINLKEQERIIVTVRRYGLTYFWHGFLVVLLLSSAFFFMFWLFAHHWWGISLFFMDLGVGILLLFRTLFIWQKNQLIVTTHRVIDIDQQGFFDKTVSEIPYDQIEDVAGRTKGIFGTIFRYGELNIQTGAGKIQIVLQKIKQPVALQQQINELRERYVSRYSSRFSGDVAEMLIDKIYELEEADLRRVAEAVGKRLQKL
jgi:membrane protein YdbS with pleckstrin-like domain